MPKIDFLLRQDEFLDLPPPLDLQLLPAPRRLQFRCHYGCIVRPNGNGIAAVCYRSLSPKRGSTATGGVGRRRLGRLGLQDHDVFGTAAALGVCGGRRRASGRAEARTAPARPHPSLPHLRLPRRWGSAGRRRPKRSDRSKQDRPQRSADAAIGTTHATSARAPNTSTPRCTLYRYTSTVSNVKTTHTPHKYGTIVSKSVHLGRRGKRSSAE